jgi:hypothetical protein
MKKENVQWTVRQLLEKADEIEFPEYQREPTVWDLEKKRKLIDSMLRDFDISSIYLYRRDDGYYECIDGRQRINAILSFLGVNDESESNYHNKFVFVSSDELLQAEDKRLAEFHGKGFEQLTGDQQDRILEYRFNVLEIADIEKDEELNLMFLRLQLGSPLNAGEKLHAMRGEMRDLVFGSLGEHPYFEYLDIPRRRFSRQLTAAQIAMNFFSLHERNGFTRTRFIDLQEFLKTHSKFDREAREGAVLLKERLDRIHTELSARSRIAIRNRAIGITMFFFIDHLIETGTEGMIQNFLDFLALFLERLNEQVKKGILIDPQYRDLLKFQTYVSQAAVEKYAIENRQTFLEDYFKYYLTYSSIKGDA